MSKRILLIDDDEQLGPPLAAYFARFELQLEQATRPSAGLALLRQAHGGFDAAILDVMLPRKNFGRGKQGALCARFHRDQQRMQRNGCFS
mgnify:CR=1 FL=1